MKYSFAILALCAFAPGRSRPARVPRGRKHQRTARLLRRGSPPNVLKPKGVEKVFEKDARGLSTRTVSGIGCRTTKLKNICRGVEPRGKRSFRFRGQSLFGLIASVPGSGFFVLTRFLHAKPIKSFAENRYCAKDERQRKKMAKSVDYRIITFSAPDFGAPT